MVSMSFIDGFYSRPRIDMELLSAHHEGLIALSGCIAGKVPQCIITGTLEEAEAEGLMKKAEAMKQYGEAAMADMQMQAIKTYFEQLPEIARAVGEGYQGVDKIVMLGNDSGQLAGNIMSTTTQISEGLSESIGIDLKGLLTGMLGAKIMTNGENN